MQLIIDFYPTLEATKTQTLRWDDPDPIDIIMTSSFFLKLEDAPLEPHKNTEYVFRVRAENRKKSIFMTVILI